MSLSDLFEDVGKEGLFQILVISVILTTQMPILWGLTMMSFASYEPDWCCSPVNPEQHPNESCVSSVYEHGGSVGNSSTVGVRKPWIHSGDDNCDGMDMALCYAKKYLDDKQASTAVTEWDLTCDRDWIVKVISSTQMVGVLIGALLSGIASDWLGRKGIYLASLFTHAAFNLLAASADSWETFAAYRFFIGSSIGCFLVVNFPYLIEFLSPKWRFIPSALPLPSLGASALPLCAWLIPDWMWIHVITGIFTAILMLAALFVPESLRWLTVKGRAGEALEVAHTIAKVNGKLDNFDKDRVYDQILKVFHSVQRKKAKEGKAYSYLDLYKTRKMAWLSIRLQLLWFTNALMTYGVIFDVDGLSGDIYTNMLIVSIVDVPVIIVTYFVAKRASRKWTAGTYSTLATVASIIALVASLISVPGRDDIVTVMCITVKALLSGGMFVVVAVVTSEKYPTVLRSYGIGATNVAAKFGGILAPFVIDVNDMATVSFSIAVAMCVLSTLVILTLEESKDAAMEDAEALNSSSYRSRRSSFHQSIGSSIIHSYHQDEDVNDYDDDAIIDEKRYPTPTHRYEYLDNTRRPSDVQFRSENRSLTNKPQSDDPFLVHDVSRSYGSVSSTKSRWDQDKTAI